MRESGEKRWLWHFGLAMYRYRWIVVLIWTLIFAGLGYFAHKVPDLLKDNGFSPYGSESETGQNRMQSQLGHPPSMLTIVYTSDRLNLRSEHEVQTILSSLDDLRKLPFVTRIKVNQSERLLARHGIQSIHVELSLDNAKALDKYPEIRSRIHAPEGMKVYVDGGTATLYDIQQATRKDMSKSELWGLPIALVVLLIIFGTFLAAILPLIVGVMSVAVALGITYFIAERYSLSNFLPNLVTMVGLAIGIDYALFIVSRFREELKRYSDVGEAVATTCQTAGKSILFSGFAVLISMLGMLFIDLPVMRALCLGGVLVVSAAVLSSSTLLPALLGLFGHNINRLQMFPGLQRKRGNSILWERIAFFVMKHPTVLVLLMSGILVVLMLPIGGIKLGVPNAEVLPPTYESRQGSDLLKQTYDARQASPIQIVVDAPGVVWEQAAIRDIHAYSEQVRRLPNVNRVRSYITVLGNHSPEETAALVGPDRTKRRLETQRLAKGHTALLVVVPRSDPDSAATANLVKQIRRLDTGRLHTYTSGAAAYRVDIMDRVNRGLPATIGFVMAVTYVILFAAFKSVLLPLKAVIMNVLSLGASLGIVVIVFQEGLMAKALNITSTGYVSVVLPVTIFCVVFGISMDYEVFLISRIMEEYERTRDNDWSTAFGLKQTGGLITSAAFILIVVVGSFIFTDIEITKAIGVGLFSAIFIDATFIRVIVVPALMKLLGRANWWRPSWGR
jgi:RND superfamily putative drug exporter